MDENGTSIGIVAARACGVNLADLRPSGHSHCTRLCGVVWLR